MKIIETENLHKCDLINFSELFEEIKACRWKEDLVNTYARYGIKDDTKKTGPTDNIDKSGKSKDLYASFRTPDNKRTATHILFEVNKIRVNTNDSIAFSSYFSNYEIHDNTNDISFDNDGRILISNNLSHNNLIYMNIRENMKINITDEAKKYMKYHRENIFID